MDYSSVDYEGEKDLFRVELKFYKKWSFLAHLNTPTPPSFFSSNG
jgi:hypothetical protein